VLRTSAPLIGALGVMNTVAAVRYRLFDREIEAMKAAYSSRSHELDAEIVLTLQDGREIFVSWVSDPEQYCVGYGATSYFVADADLHDHDVSSTLLWRGLIGGEPQFDFLANDRQVLAISSGLFRVLICSFEQPHWFVDVLTVCTETPEPHDA
jgi:hypothetical protein